MPKIPEFGETRPKTWKKLSQFLRDRGCTPQSNGTWPVNYADAVDFALEQVRSLKKQPPLRDRSVAILQVVRQLRNTCPGCGESSEDPQTMFRSPGDTIVKIGEFKWHQSCVYKPINGTASISTSPSAEVKDLKDVIEEQDTDLRTLVSAILGTKMKSTAGFRLQVLASEIKDKYTTWSESTNGV